MFQLWNYQAFNKKYNIILQNISNIITNTIRESIYPPPGVGISNERSSANENVPMSSKTELPLRKLRSSFSISSTLRFKMSTSSERCKGRGGASGSVR